MASKGDIVTRLKSFTPAQLRAGLKTANQIRGANLYQILKFDGRSGVMVIRDGQKEVRFPEGAKLAFDIFSSTQGHVCWNNGEVVGQYDKSFFELLPDIATMEDHGPYEDPEKDGWNTSYTLFLKDLKSNTQYKLQIGSISGRKQVDRLYQQIGDLEALHDFTKQTPVVVIEAEPFTSKGNKNYKPVFTIVEWLDNPEPSTVTSPVNTEVQNTQQKALPGKKGAADADSVAD